MAVKVKIIRAKDFLQVSPDGELALEESKLLLAKVASAKRPPADYDVLIDLRRVQWRLSTTDIYFLAAGLDEHREVFEDKVALLVLPGANFNKAEFFELCAQNRGYRVEAFTNFEDAIHWLFNSTTSHHSTENTAEKKGGER
jgi:hypothetical protein